MNPNKTKQLAEKMGWTDGPIGPKPRAVPYFFTDWQENLIKVEGDVGRIWNPETSDADMVELLQTLMLDVSVTIQRRDPRMNVPKQFVAGNEQLAIVCQGETLRAAVVSFSCRVWGIEE